MSINRQPVLRFVDVTKGYSLGGAEFKAVKPTNLAVFSGDYISIKGPSGSGKSTLIHLMGLLDTPTTGKIYLEGQDVSGLSETKLAKIRNRKIGFVFQQFNLLSRTTAWENVALPLVYAGIPSASRKILSLKALAAVGLAEKYGNNPNQLSGGQQQRVAIARAIVTDPMIILADEPTGNLDTFSGRAIMDLFDKFNRQGKIIILVTHEESVAKHASRKITIVDGVVRETNK
ncbi:ABC transporter ATP-binding protein [Candidatus Collierbacteria bacterium]|nr:ABC transporter ATP-binding protein [Candidatus Collierbacteria bacterium]